MKFEEAIGYLKGKEGVKLYLKSWEKDTYIHFSKLKTVEGKEIDAFIMHCKYGDVPWIPNIANILYDEWYILDEVL